MTLSWADAAAVQAAGGQVDIAVFLRIGTAVPVRCWSGIGDYAVPADAIEPAGAIFSGVGALLPLPPLQNLINGQAERVEFGLSGVSPEALALADDEAVDVRGATVNLGVVFLGRDLQPVSPTGWLWQGRADVVTPGRTAGDGQSGPVRTITLSVGSAFTGRRRAAHSYFTQADQARRSADDRFCERTNLYSSQVIKTWPDY